MAAENFFETNTRLFNYQHICIDTDLEPDDKAALSVLFRVLHEQRHDNYPKITIIAGSSKNVALKVAQVHKIISDSKKMGFIPQEMVIGVIGGTPTNKEHLNDGKELLSEEKRLAITPYDFAGAASEFLSDFLRNNPTGEKRVYFGLRSMQDLIKACEDLTKEHFHQVDFIGTLSFNVRSACATDDDCKKFVSILERFNHTLCYEGFHSAKGNTSTATGWKNFRTYLLSSQGKRLRKAGAYWNEGNIRYCIDLLFNSNCPGNKVEALGLTEEQVKIAKPLFETALQQANLAKSFEPNKETFEKTVLAILDIESKSDAAKNAFFSVFKPFCNMVFNSPEICLADVAMTALLCHPSLLEEVKIHKRLTYKNAFSNVTDYQLCFVKKDNLWQDEAPADTIEIRKCSTGFECRITDLNKQTTEFTINSFNVDIHNQKSLDANKKSVLQTLAYQRCIPTIAYVVMNEEQLAQLEEYTMDVLTRLTPLQEERLNTSYVARRDHELLINNHNSSPMSSSQEPAKAPRLN